MTDDVAISKVVTIPLTPPIRAVVPLGSGVVIAGGAGLWTGEGPPGVMAGAEVGDEYLDLLSGDLYTLQPGV